MPSSPSLSLMRRAGPLGSPAESALSGAMVRFTPVMAKVMLSVSTSLRLPSKGESSYPMGMAPWRVQVARGFRALVEGDHLNGPPQVLSGGAGVDIPALAESTQSRNSVSPTTPLLKVTGVY